MNRPIQVADQTLDGAADRTVMGAFVTLKRQGRLRACCGALGRPMPLATALSQAAVRTASEDARLPTISPTELAHLDVDVSLLYGFLPINEQGRQRLAAVEVGRHGLQIRRGEQSGLLLPVVAVEQGYDSEQFLVQVSRKAGLPATAWQDPDTMIQTFETANIEGPFYQAALSEVTAVPPLLSADEFQTMLAHCANNIPALASGATPSYYIPGVSDGTVNGIGISLGFTQSAEAVHFFRLQMRPGMPLQSTLFQLTESIAESLRSGRLQPPPNSEVQLALSLLHDPAMHGSVAEPDLRGLNPQNRALLVTENGKSVWSFDPQKTAAELLESVRNQIDLFNPDGAQLFSFAVQTTMPQVTINNVPRPATGPTIRPAAVAGSFYPADPQELSSLLDEYLATDAAQTPVACPAVMVPHAGLRFSGRVAGQVFARIEVPPTVIVIGPKHTRLGVEWAVAPHEKWSLPGGDVAADPQLAQRLAHEISGLELDAAAHQGEHGIEVELPFLAKRNPQVKVVGIAIGAGDLQRCRHFAEGLVRVLKQLEQQPLLVISSDMNHYASDEENRRLDEIAMQALERLDPTDVFQTVTGNGISMCGVRPAVMVLETLRQLNSLSRCERVSYATSGDVSGDTSRVVGYCGMLFQ